MARIIFSIGSKIFETDQNGQNFRQILNNENLEISSFDYNYEKKLFYLADDKNNKVYFSLRQSNNFNLKTLLYGPEKKNLPM